ncbi:MAG TPA: cohesin domain-containing protein, partial [bacterium]|nr:cohesin domain-containing protein [bacterium]
MLPGKLGAAISTLFLMASISMAVTVSVPSSTDVPQGGLVSIPVNVDNPRGIMGFQFVLTWGANNNVIEALTVTSGSLTGGWFISGNTETPGTVNIAGFSLSPLTGTASGSLCLIQFKVNGTAGQQATLNFTTSVLSDSQGQAITHTATGGNVSVVVASPATINGTINYGGTSQGTIYVGLFLDRNYNSEPVYSTSLANPGAFSISGIMSGTYYIGAFRDADGDGQYDVLTDPAGEYAGNPLAVSAGSTVNDVNIILQEPAFPATRQVSIPNNLTGGPGRVVNVPINVDEGAGVASFRFVIEYDSTVVEDTGIERGSLLPATWLVLRRQLSAGKTEITGQT